MLHLRGNDRRQPRETMLRGWPDFRIPCTAVETVRSDWTPEELGGREPSNGGQRYRETVEPQCWILKPCNDQHSMALFQDPESQGFMVVTLLC